jgi:hypothetical protein
MRLMALAVAVNLLWPVSADAQAAVSYLETGNMLYADCSTSMGRTACISYVMGVTDALSLMGAICTPEHSTARQAIDVVVKYLGAHPEQRPLSAAMQVRGALQEAFPCKEQGH